MGDNDRLFVVDKRGRLRPGFRSRMKDEGAETASGPEVDWSEGG